MEDIIIGRESKGFETIVELPDEVEKPLCEGNPDRIAITLGIQVNAVTQYRFTRLGDVLGGVSITNVNNPVTLNLETHGNLITKPLYGFYSGGTQNVTVVEVVLERRK